ncbi:MAG: molybdate ABC transporter permease subunit [Candidatus Firestonebacteria bacterium]|nr:molybdate ABC transporter permease subunit [Candidatus Firestonebacteria bacterium]
MQNLSIIIFTFKIAAFNVLIGLPIAISFALLVRKYPGWLTKILETASMLPLVLPPVVTGFLLLGLLGKNGLIQSYTPFKFDIIFTWKAAVIASTVISFPLIYKPIKIALFSYDRRLELVARSLGSTRWKVYRTIIFPLCRKGIITGSLLGFARSIGEFGATVILLGNIYGKRTLSIEIYNLIEIGKENEAYILIFVSVLISLIVISATEVYERI